MPVRVSTTSISIRTTSFQSLLLRLSGTHSISTLFSPTSIVCLLLFGQEHLDIFSFLTTVTIATDLHSHSTNGTRPWLVQVMLSGRTHAMTARSSSPPLKVHQKVHPGVSLSETYNFHRYNQCIFRTHFSLCNGWYNHRTPTVPCISLHSATRIPTRSTLPQPPQP